MQGKRSESRAKSGSKQDRKARVLQGALAVVLAVITLMGLAGRWAEAKPFTLESKEFPLGMFSVDSPGAMDDVEKMGIDYLHTYALGASNEPEAIAQYVRYLDEAQKRGLKVMFNLDGGRWVKRPDGVEALMKLVRAVKDHPALGFWYFYDEPDGEHTPEELRPFYEALKKETPEIPVAIASAWSEHWDAYNDDLDLLMIDIYPVKAKPFPKSDVSLMTTFTDQALGLGKPVMPINQAINWRVFAKGRKVYQGAPVEELRFPNAAELRYWCYSEAAQGVRGMFWWSHTHAERGSKEWLEGPFAETMKGFRRFIEATKPTYPPTYIFKRARDGHFIAALWRRPSGVYLVAVNAWPLEQEMGFWLEDKLSEAVLEPWGSTRAVKARVHKSHIEGVTARPWEVFVWKVSKAWGEE